MTERDAIATETGMTEEGSLLDQLRHLMDGRVCVLGVGNRYRRDDGAGSLLAERLGQRTNTMVIDAGVVPENYLEKVARSHPDTILIIDAVDFGGTPGEFRILEVEFVGPSVFSTHALSLRMAADFLRARTRAHVALLAIQPSEMGLGAGLSEEVSRAVELLEETFVSAVA